MHRRRCGFSALWLILIMLLFSISCGNDSSTNPEPSSFSVSGRIVDTSGNGVAGVSVAVSGKSAVSDSTGAYNIQGLANGSYSTIFSKDGFTFEPSSVQVTVSGSDVTVDVVMAIESGPIPVNFTFVSIPSGTFRMGDIQNYNQYSREKPVHDVSLSSFQMSIYEVTQSQYKSVMGSNPSSLKSGDNYPVEKVLWFDAVNYCNRLSDKAGYNRCYDESTLECDFSKNGFRLPTEAEWEYACRAGMETKYYTGNELSSDGKTSTDLEKAGWYNGNSDSKSHIVGEKEPNEWGLYDMHGNVWEWCNDWFDESYYSSSPSSNPTGPSSGSHRVIRGGSWISDSGVCRSAFRYWFDPNFKFITLGFRVVRRPGE